VFDPILIEMRNYRPNRCRHSEAGSHRQLLSIWVMTISPACSDYPMKQPCS